MRFIKHADAKLFYADRFTSSRYASLVIGVKETMQSKSPFRSTSSSTRQTWNLSQGSYTKSLQHLQYFNCRNLRNFSEYYNAW